MVKLFGFNFTRADQEVPEPDLIPSIIPPNNDDGAAVVMAGGTQAALLDMDGAVRSEADLIGRYREAALHPEVESAVDDIVNAMVVTDSDAPPVLIDLSDLELPDNLKEIITSEFDHVLKLLHFNHKAYETLRSWYVDGRLYYLLLINEEDPQQGLIGLRQVNALNLRKVRELVDAPDPDGFRQLAVTNEYYVYQESGFKPTNGSAASTTWSMQNNQLQSTRISKDSIVHVTSGLQDGANNMVLSYLQGAIKPLNQLRMLEDASIIYRLVRSPTRRMWSVDVGGLPRGKAEQHVNNLMQRHKNKVVYDQSTGELRNDRKFLTMLEDYWFPNQNGKGTTVTNLDGAGSFMDLQDIEYFKNKLYESLKIPKSRTDSAAAFSLGRPSEIQRDEIKFSKFVSRLRTQFQQLFLKLLSTQLILKQIVSGEEWAELIEPVVRFKFTEDNYFEELKQSEVLQNRLATLQQIDQFVGVYYSRAWVARNVLKQTEAEVEEIERENAADAAFLQARAEQG